MKKLLAMLLCIVMVLSLFAGCNGDPSTTESTSGNETQGETQGETTVETTVPVVAEALPETALYYWGFEDATGLAAVTQGEKAADSANDGATYDIVPTDHEILIAEGQGAVGNALYLDGKYGVQLDLTGMDISDDSYSISFWYNADRVSTYGPVVQMGRNVGKANTTATVTWLNWTKTTWGANSADIFPVVWNRNSSIGTDVAADGVWPWMAAMDDLEHGKREWCLVTLVVDGVEYTCVDDGLPRIGAYLYLNGELMHYATSENLFYQGVSPEILTGDGIEGYIGINYWDTIFKGYIDELYIYDEVLTAGQVKSLYEAGNPPAEPVAPEYVWGEEEVETEPQPLAAAPVDEAAIDTLGTTDRALGWWTENTQSWELADGASVTVKMNNYSSGVSNWHNFVVGLINTPVTAELVPSADNYAGYAEYAVVRADAYGWGDASYAGAFTMSWTDWAAWLALMTDAEVTMVISRNGGEVTMDFTFTGADGTVMTEQAVITSTLTAEAPCHFFIGGEGAYIEILSVE